MTIKRKMGRKQTKSVLVARLRLFSMQTALYSHVLWIGEKCPISVSQKLENRRFPALFLRDLGHFSEPTVDATLMRSDPSRA